MATVLDRERDELWQVGETALSQLARACGFDDEPGDQLFAKAAVAGTFSLMAVRKASDTSRGFRLLTLLMFEANLEGAAGENNRVTLATFVSRITNVRQDWVELYDLPAQMNRETWEVLAQLMHGAQLGPPKWRALSKLNPQMSVRNWWALVDYLKTQPIMNVVQY